MRNTRANPGSPNVNGGSHAAPPVCNAPETLGSMRHCKSWLRLGGAAVAVRWLGLCWLSRLPPGLNRLPLGFRNCAYSGAMRCQKVLGLQCSHASCDHRPCSRQERAPQREGALSPASWGRPDMRILQVLRWPFRGHRPVRRQGSEAQACAAQPGAAPHRPGSGAREEARVSSSRQAAPCWRSPGGRMCRHGSWGMPVPAAVMACRHFLSWTSPQAKTASRLVCVVPGVVAM